MTFSWVAPEFCTTSTIQAHDHRYIVARLALDLNYMFVTVQVIFNRLLLLIQHELLDDRVKLCSVREASSGFTIHPQHCHSQIMRSGSMRPEYAPQTVVKHLISHMYTFNSGNVHEVHVTWMHLDSHFPQSHTEFKTTSCDVLLYVCTMYTCMYMV